MFDDSVLIVLACVLYNVKITRINKQLFKVHPPQISYIFNKLVYNTHAKR